MSKVSEQTPLIQNKKQNPYIIIKSKLSQLFFWWVVPLVKIGRRQPLCQSDLISIDANLSTSKSFQHYRKVYDASDSLSLSQVLYKSFRCQIWSTLLMYFIGTFLILIGPYVTYLGQSYFIYENNEDKPTFMGMITFAIFQLLYWLGISIIIPYMLFEQSILSIRIQGALQQHILQKTLAFPLSRSKIYSSGDLINILQVDITQASNYFVNAYQLYVLPIYFIFASAIFFVTVKENSIVAGIGSVVQALFGILFGYFYGQIQNKFMHAKDQRMSAVDETLLYTKQIKLNCLEQFFEDRIEQLRKQELKFLKYQVWMLIGIQLVQNIIGLIIWEVTFIFANQLNFAIVNVLIQNYVSVLNLLLKLPIQLRNYYISKNSVLRIQQFLKQKEIQFLEDKGVVNSDEKCMAIAIQHSHFSWQSIDLVNQEQMEEIHNDFSIKVDFKIQKGQFVAFVGNSASGKSSILRSILGEMKQLGGSYQIAGQISLATQEPWIISGSVKQNITYMNDFDISKYKKVINACGLERDIKSFQDGENTILGEKGDNISGGQQKRINLARAVYSDADIYLFDDPMSALDIKIRQHIHENCIMGYLKNKTRILFTSSMAYLQDADMIYVIEQGEIVDSGTFNQLKSTSGQARVIEERKEIMDVNFEDIHYPPQETTITNESGELIQVEDQDVGTIKKEVVRQIYRYQGGVFAVLVIIMFIGTLLGCQILGNQLLTQDMDEDEFKALALIAFPIIKIPIFVMQLVLVAYFLTAGLITSRGLHRKLMNNLLGASFTKFYNTILIGRLMNRLSKDIYNIDIMFPNEIQGLGLQLATLLLPLVAGIVFLNPVTLPIPIMLLIALIYLTSGYYKCIREVTRIEAVSKSPVFTFFQQLVRGITYVRSCLPLESVLLAHQKNVDLDLANQICLNGLKYWYQTYAGIVTNIFLTLLFICCVLHIFKLKFIFPGSTQKLTYLILSQLSTIASVLVLTALSYGNLQMYSISFERCLHLANNIEKEENQINVGLDQNQQIQNKITSINPIEFGDCSFQYRLNCKEVLSNITAEIQKGEKIGVVGRTGAGKSSIILALTGMIEQTQGQLLIDGQNIQTYGLKELRQKYSVIPQDPLVFMGTLRDNLDPLKQYETDKIEKVCQNCQLFSLDSFKTDQLLTQISVGGCNLSMGEKQMITIARCVLQNRKIILVDEATASIDGPTEMKIKQMFEQYFQSNTVITIAHKVTTIMDSNRIMVLDDGKIIEFDTPQTLLEDPNSEFKQILGMIQEAELL